jgi:hypothetical protein
VERHLRDVLERSEPKPREVERTAGAGREVEHVTV